MSQSSYTMKMKNTLVEYKKNIMLSRFNKFHNNEKPFKKRPSQFKNISNI